MSFAMTVVTANGHDVSRTIKSDGSATGTIVKSSLEMGIRLLGKTLDARKYRLDAPLSTCVEIDTRGPGGGLCFSQGVAVSAKKKKKTVRKAYGLVIRTSKELTQEEQELVDALAKNIEEQTKRGNVEHVGADEVIPLKIIVDDE